MDCQCNSSDQCKYEVVRKNGGRLFDICKGLALTPERRALYRELWVLQEKGIQSQGLKGSLRKTGKGPGSHLKLLLSNVGLVDDGKCGCKELSELMDMWGPKGCQENRTFILDKLKENAKSLGWYEKLRVGALFIQEPWFKITDRFGSLVDESIRRSEKEVENDRSDCKYRGARLHILTYKEIKREEFFICKHISKVEDLEVTKETCMKCAFYEP